MPNLPNQPSLPDAERELPATDEQLDQISAKLKALEAVLNLPDPEFIAVQIPKYCTSPEIINGYLMDIRDMVKEAKLFIAEQKNETERWFSNSMAKEFLTKMLCSSCPNFLDPDKLLAHKTDYFQKGITLQNDLGQVERNLGLAVAFFDYKRVAEDLKLPIIKNDWEKIKEMIITIGKTVPNTAGPKNIDIFKNSLDEIMEPQHLIDFSQLLLEYFKETKILVESITYPFVDELYSNLLARLSSKFTSINFQLKP